MLSDILSLKGLCGMVSSSVFYFQFIMDVTLQLSLT